MQHNTTGMIASGCDFQKEVGDLVQIGITEGPEYRIIAIDGEDAWIRPTNPNERSSIVPLNVLRWIREPVDAGRLAAAISLIADQTNPIFESIPWIEMPSGGYPIGEDDGVAGD